MNIKLIRTTYWTRKQSDKRPDESDDFREHNLVDIINEPMIMADMELDDPTTATKIEPSADKSVKTKMSPVVHTLVSLFCGYEPHTAENSDRLAAMSELQQKNEARRRVESFRSLNQTKCQRYILNTNLVLILVISVALYVFFSIPPQYHIFKHVPLSNATTVAH